MTQRHVAQGVRSRKAAFSLLDSNFAFGGGGIHHGAAFHRLGVEHALSDCSRFHGVEGRKDVFGFGFDRGDALDANTLPEVVSNGQLSEPDHATEGWPTFTDWPSAHDSSTRQVQYYKWLERAWMSGLRLVVQHATTDSVICGFLVPVTITVQVVLMLTVPYEAMQRIRISHFLGSVTMTGVALIFTQQGVAATASKH